MSWPTKWPRCKKDHWPECWRRCGHHASQGHFVQNCMLVRGSGKIKPKAASASFSVEILVWSKERLIFLHRPKLFISLQSQYPRKMTTIWTQKERKMIWRALLPREATKWFIGDEICTKMWPSRWRKASFWKKASELAFGSPVETNWNIHKKKVRKKQRSKWRLEKAMT